MENPSCSKEQYFKTFDEMKSNHEEDLLLNTFEIAKQCNVFLSEEEYFLPSYQIEEKISLAQHLENISKQRLEEYLKDNEKLDKDLYTTKGTDDSFEILFRALYGSKATIVKPYENRSIQRLKIHAAATRVKFGDPIFEFVLWLRLNDS